MYEFMYGCMCRKQQTTKTRLKAETELSVHICQVKWNQNQEIKNNIKVGQPKFLNIFCI